MRMTKNTLGGLLLLAALGTASLPVGAAPAGAAAAQAPGPVPGASSNESGTLDCSQLESLWEAAGGSPSAAFMAAEIATAESSGQQYATDDDGNGTVDRGYWQMNSINPGSSYDPMTNAKGAVALSDDGANWQPWVTYQTSAYVGKC